MEKNISILDNQIQHRKNLCELLALFSIGGSGGSLMCTPPLPIIQICFPEKSVENSVSVQLEFAFAFALEVAFQ